MGSGPPLTPFLWVMRVAFRGGFLVPGAGHRAQTAARFARRYVALVHDDQRRVAEALRAGLAVAAGLESIAVEAHAPSLGCAGPLLQGANDTGNAGTLSNHRGMSRDVRPCIAS